MSSTLEYQVSVTELLELRFHSKDPGSALEPKTRCQEGIAGHHLLASQRPSGYRTEVPFECDYHWENFSLKVQGRIDGMMASEDQILIEEVKTTYLPINQLSADLSPIDLTQLKIYIYMVMVQNPGKAVTGQLTYLNLDDLTERSFPQMFSLEFCRKEFESLAQMYLIAQKETKSWIGIRNLSLGQLEFPFAEYRPGQTELMDLVTQAIEQERDLFAEAATGIGKTISVLYPALKQLAVNDRIRRIFFLTAKTAGKAILRKTISGLIENGLRLRTVFIEAKERVCLAPGTRCDLCRYADDYFNRAEAVIPELIAAELITPEFLAEKAEQEGLCPFELSLDLSLQADLIICDYNYLFDPGVYLRRFFQSGKKDSLFLIDEAHNLAHRGREMYSAALSEKTLTGWLTVLKNIDPELAAPGGEIEAFFKQCRKELLRENRNVMLLPSLPDSLEPVLERWIAILENFLRLNRSGGWRDQILPIYFELIEFTRILPLIDQNYAIYVKAENREFTLKIFCLNPGPLLRRRLDKGRLAVFFSATLSPYEYFRELLGGKSDSFQIRLFSPFPKESRLYLHVPGIDTRYRARSHSLSQLVECLKTMVEAKTGNYLAFFPSYAYLQSVFPLLRQSLNNKAYVYAQFPGMAEAQKREFLARLSAGQNGRSKLGLAVLGGSFGEGIDLPGEQLIGVAIVGPGLPMVNEEQELIRIYFDERNNSGFFYAYLVPGLIKVIQAAGRVFRSAEDTGVVLLLDDRFGDERYQELLPSDWFLPGRQFTDPEYREALRRFWGEVGKV